MSSSLWWSLCCGCVVYFAPFVAGSGSISDDNTKEPRYPEPTFLPRMVNITVREGAEAKLPCAVRYLGARQVTWRKVGGQHFLTIGNFIWVKDNNVDLESVKVTPEITEWNLLLRKVHKNDSGVYQCRISASSIITRYIRLNVLRKDHHRRHHRRATIVLAGKNYVDQGQPIRLFCNTTVSIIGNQSTHRLHKMLDLARLRVDWFKDGRILQPVNRTRACSSRVIITHCYIIQTGELVSELRIDRSRAVDTGSYICRSPTDHIASHRVTVLLADTTNYVKRDNTKAGSSLSSPSSACVTAPFFPFFLVIAIGVKRISDVGVTSSQFPVIW